MKAKETRSVLLLVGPSGCGKSTIMDAYREKYGATIVPTTTTRAPREGDMYYNYVSVEDFKRDIEAGKFIEHNVYAGNYYGTAIDAFNIDGVMLKAVDIETALKLHSFADSNCRVCIVYVHRKVADSLAAVKARGLSEQDYRARTCKFIAEDSQARAKAWYAIDNTGSLDVAVEELHKIAIGQEWIPSTSLLTSMLEAVLDANPGNFWLQRDENSEIPKWIYELDAERGDRIPVDQVCKIVAGADDHANYEDLVSVVRDRLDNDWYWAVHDTVDELAASVMKELPVLSFAAERPDNKDFSVFFYLEDHVAVTPPYEHYMAQEYPANIVLDAGDANFDFGVNCISPALYGEDESIDECSGVLWLARKLGYTKAELEDALFKSDTIPDENSFLGSVRTELENVTTSMNAVTFFVRLTLDELLRINGALNEKKKGSMKIDRNANCGLVDYWNGAGGVLGIELDNDVEVPFENIFSALPDCSNCGAITYGVDDIYGLVDSFWNGSATLSFA